MNDNNVRWGISADVRATYTDEGAVLLDIEKGLCYSLNTVAARIWVTIESSEEGLTLEAVVRTLQAQFKVSRQELESDTAECLDKLQRMGLLHRNGHNIPSKALENAR